MPTQAILYLYDDTRVVLSLHEPYLHVELRRDGTPKSYVPYFQRGAGGELIGVEQIDVIYSGTSENFRLEGVTRDRKKCEIWKVDHETTSANESRVVESSVEWKYAGVGEEGIVWDFADPKNVGDEVSWTFNDSTGSPPVRVKVVLKRQS